jgi:F-box protein 9
VPTTASEGLSTRPSQAPATSTPDLIASYADAPILGAPPLIERTAPPPCPIADIPSEMLIEIVLRTAILDVSSYAGLALVCKRFAHLTITDDQIWKRIVHGRKSGFQGMHFDYDVTLSGRPLVPDVGELPDLSTLTLNVDPTARTLDEDTPPPLALSLTSEYPTYRHMHRYRPRIRFAGLYISTVNYVRPGASSATSVTWDSPVHVVTYYRYLRFLRDGSVLSLLSTAEPSDVVPHFRPENVGIGQGAQAAAGGGPGIVSVARNTLRGRWRMSPLEELQRVESGSQGDSEEPVAEEVVEPEGNVYVETKGPTASYTYTMQLALRSAGSSTSARNTKLVWRGFWSYNKISDDWAEFGLKNDRPFVWSRVRSWADS